MLDALEQRFAPDSLTATKRFNDCFLCLKDVAHNEQALAQYIQKKLH